MGGSADPGAQYSAFTGFIFVFNLIVGAGALALPLAFQSAGLILGTVLLFVLCFLGYMTITFMVEAQAIANAFLRFPEVNNNSTNIQGTDTSPLFDQTSTDLDLKGTDETAENHLFAIQQRVEVSQMAEMFLGPWGHKLFFVVIVVYLYGDLAIYATAIPNSLYAVTGTWHIPGTTCCGPQEVYYWYLGAFILIFSPFCFFDFQKTAWLQWGTMIIRNVSLAIMIVLAMIYDIKGEGSMPTQWVLWTGLPGCFGTAIYAFMCHHSLPSIVTPMSEKRHINKLFLIDNIFILATYIVLCWTAVWAFGGVKNPTCHPEPGPPCELQKLYSMNFASYNFHPLAVFLVMFPVLTLSSNFPMIAITLRNNLMQLITWKEDELDPGFRRVIFTLLTLFPPYVIAAITDKTGVLVDFTGGFAGLFIMFFFPAIFVHFGRRKVQEKFGTDVENQHLSPFYHQFWIYLIYIWCLVALGGQIFRFVWAGTH